RSHTPLTSPLFPYTTLFRSERRNATEQQDGSFASTTVLPAHMKPVAPATPAPATEPHKKLPPGFGVIVFSTDEEMVETVQQAARSEEHTSELQSRENLVCRL